MDGGDGRRTCVVWDVVTGCPPARAEPGSRGAGEGLLRPDSIGAPLAPVAAVAAAEPVPPEATSRVVPPPPGARRPAPAGKDVADLIVGGSPVAPMLLASYDERRTTYWAALACLLQSRSALGLPPAEETSTAGKVAFGSDAQSTRCSRDLEACGSGLRPREPVRNDGLIGGCRRVAAFGRGGPMAMDTTPPWGPVLPASTPMSLGTQVRSDLDGGEHWRAEMGAVTSGRDHRLCMSQERRRRG